MTNVSKEEQVVAIVATTDAKASKAKAIPGAAATARAKAKAAKAKADAKAKRAAALAKAKATAKTADERQAKRDAAQYEGRVKATDAKIVKVGESSKPFALRDNAISAILTGTLTLKQYAAGLNKHLGKEWAFITADDVKKGGGNVKALDKSIRAEHDAFFAKFKSEHSRLGMSGVANPSAYWALIKTYAKRFAKPDAVPAGVGSGKAKPVKQALLENIPGLYLRASNAPDYDTNEKVRLAAFHLGKVLELMGADLLEINAKIGSK